MRLNSVMRLSSFPVLPALAAALLAPLAYSSPSDPPAPGARLHLDCVAIQKLSGVIGTPHAVHMDSDGRRDLLTQVGDRAVFVSGPDPRQYSEEIGLPGVTALTTVPSSEGGRRTALVADVLGLASLDFFVGDTRQATFVRAQVGPLRWAGVQAIVSIDVDGDGDDDLLGLSADGTTLLRMDRIQGGGWVEAPDLALGMTLHGLATLEWAGSQAALVSYLGGGAGADDTVVVMDLAGSIYSMMTPGGTVDQIVVLDDELGADSLAVLSGSTVTVLRADGSVEAPLDWAGLAPSAASSADINSDGRADLLLNSTTKDQVQILLADADTAAPARFSATATEIVSLDLAGVDMSVQAAPPVAADFDGDGDVDVIQLLDSTRMGVVGRATGTDETTMHAGLTSSDWFLGLGTCTAFFSVEIPPLPDGSDPDWLEVTLSSTVGAPGIDGVTSVIYNNVVSTAGSQAGDASNMWIHLNQELGERTSLLIRALGDSPSGTTVDRVGPEVVFSFERTGDLDRGTNNGVDPVDDDDINTEGWPPLPPKPVTIGG